MPTEDRLYPIPGDGFVVWVDDPSVHEETIGRYMRATLNHEIPQHPNWPNVLAQFNEVAWPQLVVPRVLGFGKHMGWPIMTDIDEDHDYPLGDFVGNGYSPK